MAPASPQEVRIKQCRCGKLRDGEHWYQLTSYVISASTEWTTTGLQYYIPFHRDNGTFSNSGAYHDLAHWKAAHPDWVLYKCDRVTPAYEFGDPNMPLDFANPALVSWQIQTYVQPAKVGTMVLQQIMWTCKTSSVPAASTEMVGGCNVTLGSLMI